MTERITDPVCIDRSTGNGVTIKEKISDGMKNDDMRTAAYNDGVNTGNHIQKDPVKMIKEK